MEENTKLGRPSIYNEELLEKAREYLDVCQDEEITETVGMSAKGTELFKSKTKVRLPTKGGLARYLNVSRETLYDWASKHTDFSDIMESIGAEQEDRLINMGLSGEYNPTISKVLLTKHGYREGIDNTSNGQTIFTPLEKEEADKAINQLLNGGN